MEKYYPSDEEGPSVSRMRFPEIENIPKDPPEDLREFIIFNLHLLG